MKILEIKVTNINMIGKEYDARNARGEE